MYHVATPRAQNRMVPEGFNAFRRLMHLTDSLTAGMARPAMTTRAQRAARKRFWLGRYICHFEGVRLPHRLELAAPKMVWQKT
jgi:hypothetical protein